MAKHRSSVFTVIREELEILEEPHEFYKEIFVFSAIIGTYQSLQRAEEVMGSSAQAFRDAGVPDGMHRFSVQVGTYYDE